MGRPYTARPRDRPAPEPPEPEGWTPEQRLWRAVFNAMLEDVTGQTASAVGNYKSPRWERQARAWFRGPSWRVVAAFAGIRLGAVKPTLAKHGVEVR